MAEFEQRQVLKTEGMMRQMNEIKEMLEYMYTEKREKNQRKEQV